MGSSTVLVVDDERKIRDLVRSYLELEGYSVLLADTGARALESASRSNPDLVVLDLGLPDLPGEEVARTLRTASDVPIIMLTAKAGEDDRVAGLRLGADDYLAKPFSPRELVLRVRAVLKRGQETDASTGVLRAGPIEIDLDNHEVAVGGRSVRLTVTEFRLLVDLVRAGGRVRTRESLLSELWDYDAEVMSRTVDTHVRRLRTKLGPAASWLTTVRGVGYRFREPSD